MINFKKPNKVLTQCTSLLCQIDVFNISVVVQSISSSLKHGYSSAGKLNEPANKEGERNIVS